MSIDLIMQILQWLIPVGSAGTVIGCIFYRDLRKAREAKEKNDIYKDMYDNISGTLIELQNENKRLYKAVRQLNQTIQKATSCPHFASCPMRDELQKSERIDTNAPFRQPAKHKKSRADPDACSSGYRGNEDTGSEVNDASYGAGYSTRSGRATVNVRRTDDGDIEVTAICDSLARQVIILEEELTRIRNETGKEEKPPGVVREPTGWQWFQIWTGRIAVICLILIVIKRRFYKTKK